jgi:predicted nucleic acid-binding protein
MTGSSATARSMLDTNVLVYAYDIDAGVRHERAVQLIEELERSIQVVVSTQVLNEFYWAITRPQRTTPLSHEQATAIVREIAAAWEVVPLNAAVTLRALDGMPRHGFSFWDALIWAAARENGVSLIYTEDFQHGRDIEGVGVIDPFSSGGGS